jgi:hypothetical protein
MTRIGATAEIREEAKDAAINRHNERLQHEGVEGGIKRIYYTN